MTRIVTESKLIMQAEKLIRAQIRWRCRRGMLECDLFLIAFFDACFDELTEEEQETFVELLDSPDPELLAWLMGHDKPQDQAFQAMIQKIRSFKYNRQCD